jgi:hypothetical protein
MYPRDIRVNNPTEALIVEKALAMARELNRTACDAPDGHVLARAETLAVDRGRELTRISLEATLQDQAQEVEKKGRRRGPARAADRKNTAGNGNECS